MVLILGVIVLTSAKPTDTKPVVEDYSYLEEVEEYVDSYFEELTQEAFQLPDYVRIFDANDNLVLEGERSSLLPEQTQVLNQADLLTEDRGTAYYQLNK